MDNNLSRFSSGTSTSIPSRFAPLFPLKCHWICLVQSSLLKDSCCERFNRSIFPPPQHLNFPLPDVVHVGNRSGLPHVLDDRQVLSGPSLPALPRASPNHDSEIPPPPVVPDRIFLGRRLNAPQPLPFCEGCCLSQAGPRPCHAHRTLLDYLTFPFLFTWDSLWDQVDLGISSLPPFHFPSIISRHALNFLSMDQSDYLLFC